MIHSWINKAAIAAVLSVSFAPIASAIPTPSSIGTTTPGSILIAQASTSGLSPKAEMLLDLFSQYMSMKKMGEDAMKSSDPAMQKMGETMVKMADQEFSKLSKLLREEFLKNPDR